MMTPERVCSGAPDDVGEASEDVDEGGAGLDGVGAVDVLVPVAGPCEGS